MKPFVLATILVLAPSVAHANAARTTAKHPVAAPQPAAPTPELSDEEVNARVESYLGSIDTPIPMERWQQLGAKAEPLLLGVINDHDALPTRRARAVEGLAAVGTAQAPTVLNQIALTESEPLTVRLAAIRGLAWKASDREVVARLRPLLDKPKDSRVRAAAAKVLARRVPRASCELVRARAAQEPERSRGEFAPALQACEGSASEK